MESLRSGNTGGSVNVPREEYNILRSKVVEQKSHIDELNKQLKITEEELKSAHVTLSKERKKSNEVAVWQEYEKVLLQEMQRVKSTGKIDVETEQGFEEPLDQIMYLVAKQHAELKRIRSKSQKQVENIELLVDMLIRSQKNIREIPRAIGPAIEPSKSDIYSSELSQSVQCTDDLTEKRGAIMMLLKGNQIVDRKDIGDNHGKESDFGYLSARTVKSSDGATALSNPNVYSNNSRIQRTNYETSGISSAQYSYQQSSNPQGENRVYSMSDNLKASLTQQPYSNVQSSQSESMPHTLMSSTAMKSGFEGTHRIHDVSGEAKECPFCFNMFSVVTTVEEDQFNKHVDDHIDEFDRRQVFK